MLYDLLLLFVGLIILIIGGDYLVKGSTRIALRVHISPLVVGLTIVAFGTSAPELLISLKSALTGSPDLAMGNVVGSNICNLALVLGTTALISEIKVKPDSMTIDWPVAMGGAILLYILGANEILSFWEGGLFVIILIVYIYFIVTRSRRRTKAKHGINLAEEVDLPDNKPSTNLRKDIVLLVIGSAGLYFGAEWFVGGAQNLARNLGVSERVIGITVLALGTSLPELVTAIVAAFKKETDLAMGNLIGSNIFNIFSILGITSLVTEINVNPDIRNIDMLWMLGITFLILPLMITSREVQRIEGGFLLAVYAFYIYTLV